MPAVATRSRWIDVARGVGVTLVVAGHNPGLWAAAPELGRMIFAVHMPLFFAVAGTTLPRTPGWLAVLQRSAALWLSYVVLCLLSMPLALRRADHDSLPQTLLGVLYGTGHTIVIPPLWFLPCLALTLLATHALDRLLARLPGTATHPLRTDAAMAGIAASLGVLLLTLQGAPTLQPRLGWGTLASAGAPLNLDLVPIGVAFVCFGRACRALITQHAGARHRLWAAAAAAALAFALLYAVSAPRLDLNLRVVVPGLAALGVAAAGTAALLLLAYLLQHTRAAAAAAALGSMTLVVLWLHAGIEKRAWETLGAALPVAPAIVASIGVALLLPWALDRALLRVPRLRGLIYPQGWLARRSRTAKLTPAAGPGEAPAALPAAPAPRAPPT